MKRFVLLLTAAVMLAAVCFSGCKGAVGIDSGRKKDPIRFTAEPTQAVLPTDLVLPTSVPESLSVNEKAVLCLMLPFHRMSICSRLNKRRII